MANLTHCKPDEIAALRLALKHKGNLFPLQSVKDFVELRQGKSAGAVLALYEIARRLGIEKALGTERAGKLALWQVLSRVIGQGSCLLAVRLAQRYAACDVLGLWEGFSEEQVISLYYRYHETTD